MSPARAALYQRVSDGTVDSVEQQNKRNEAAAKRHGWRTATYEDKVSASRFSRRARPGWEALVSDVTARKFSYVVLWEPSRGDRKLSTWASFLDTCRETRTGIYITSHGKLYDVTNARDWRSLAEDGIDSAYESEKTSLRVHRHFEETAGKGLPHGRIPFGYRRTYEAGAGGRRALQLADETEAPVVREVIERIASGEAVVRIIRDLDDRGIRTRAGGRWARASVNRMVLEGVVYIGKRRWDGQLLDGDWPALVQPDVYWRAIAVLRDPARKKTAEKWGGIRTGRAKWLLSYVAACDSCGAPLSATTHNRPEPYYRCSGRAKPGTEGCAFAPVAWMDEQVAEAVINWCARPGVYELITAADDEEAQAARDEAEAERARLAEFEAQAISGLVSAGSFARIAAGIEARISELEARAAQVSAPPVLRELVAEAWRNGWDTETARADIRERWDGLPIDSQRQLIRNLFELRLRPCERRGSAANLRDPARILITWPELRWPCEDAQSRV